MEVEIEEKRILSAVKEGMAAFVQLISDALLKEVNGRLDAKALSLLSSEQITLIGYTILRREVLEGGFVQLIYNGYGPFFFRNPYAKSVRKMGAVDLAKILYDVRRLYDEKGSDLAQECSDEDFMALYEKYPEFDEFDDSFVDNEEEYTGIIAHYVDDHIGDFVKIIK